MDFNIIIYIIFGVVPSLIWLFYYLSKDLHPEPKRMILTIFFWGCLITIPVFFVQIGLLALVTQLHFSTSLSQFLYWFLIVGFSEEFFKYIVVRTKVINSPDFDEPLDAMLYMVISALGFAAVENILYLFAPAGPMSFNALIQRTLALSFMRFIGATFLHTLCSAVVGYAIAVSCYTTKERYLSVGGGLCIAMVLHGLYDFSIMTLTGYIQLAIPALILTVLAVFVFIAFDRLKKVTSTCKVDVSKLKKSRDLVA